MIMTERMGWLERSDVAGFFQQADEGVRIVRSCGVFPLSRIAARRQRCSDGLGSPPRGETEKRTRR